MSWRPLSVLLLLCLVNPVAASDIDQVFTSKSRQTWGQWFKSFYQPSDFNKSYALVIGVSQFDNFENLATTQDPVKMKDYLLNEAGFDYVRLITGRAVNVNKIRSIMLDDMPRRLRANDRFVFYWSGHGMTNPGNGRQFGYLPVADSQKDMIGGMLSMNDLAEWDEQLQAKQTLYLLDACFSGLALGHQMQSDGREQTLQQIARPSRQILTAGVANEQTIVVNRLGGSVFTTAVLDGLRGEADTESGPFKKDGVVSARELELYVKRRVAYEATQEKWKKSITPLLTRLNNREGDFFFFSEQTVAAAPAGSVIQMARRGGEGQGVASMSGNDPVEPRSVNGARLLFEPEMIPIPAGSFTMGCKPGRDDVEGGCSDDGKPAHTVQISAFLIGKYEVTFDEWDACERVKACPHAEDQGWGRGRRPVINVSWNDAQKYLQWLSRETGKQYRLPTEAEWEYAARGRRESAFPWGNQIGCGNARYGFFMDGNPCKSYSTVVVGSYGANGFGLHDTAGNVWEWVGDWYGGYAADSASDPKGPGSGSDRVLRGGSWYRIPQYLRSAYRNRSTPDLRDYNIGFRPAQVQ